MANSSRLDTTPNIIFGFVSQKSGSLVDTTSLWYLSWTGIVPKHARVIAVAAVPVGGFIMGSFEAIAILFGARKRRHLLILLPFGSREKEGTDMRYRPGT